MTNGGQPPSSKEGRNPGMEGYLVEAPLDEETNQDTMSLHYNAFAPSLVM